MEKDKQEFNAFQAQFSSHFSEAGSKTPRIIKPICIKYIPDLVVRDTDPLNRGKIQQPRSLAINHVSQIQDGDSNVEIRYTKTAPTRNPATGQMEWKGYQSTDVKGSLRTTDIDLAYFFWRYSNQNIKNNPNAKLMIENRKQEAEEKARVQRSQATIQARLWNDEKDGGSSIELLKRYAVTRPSIAAQADEMDENELRLAIERDFTLDRTTTTKMKFLEFTNPGIVPPAEFHRMNDFVGEAIEAGVISQNNPNKGFYWKTEEGKMGELIWSWDGSRGAEKPAIKFVQYLEANDTSTIDKIVEATHAKKLEAATA